MTLNDDSALRDEHLEPSPEGTWRGPRLMVSLRADYFVCLSSDKRGESYCAHVYAPVWRKRADRYGSIAVSADEWEWLQRVLSEAEALAAFADREPLIDPRLRWLH